MIFLGLGAGLLLLLVLMGISRANPLQFKKILAFMGLAIGGILLAVFALSGRIALAGGVGFIMLYAIRILRALDAPPSASSSSSSSARPKSDTMTRREALDLLGLQAGATKREIDAAYKKRIKKAHPDMGGTADLTRKLNEARQILKNDL